MTARVIRTIERILVGPRVIGQLPRELNILGADPRLLMVADWNTYRAAGKRVAAVLGQAGCRLSLCILRRRNPRPDEEALGQVLSAVEPDCGFLLAVGSGTVNDLTRYAAHLTGRPYAVIATAPSMDGYASSVAALTVKGCKKTFDAVPPRAIFGDLDVLAGAPPEMIRSGFGDLLGKYTALADWQLGHVIAGEGFSASIEAAVRRAVDDCSATAGGQDRQKHVQTLTVSLVKSGLGMLGWGDSRPASGSEHHVSHFLEMWEGRGGGEMHLHGTMVGIAEVYMTAVYHNLFQRDAAAVREWIGRRKPEGATAFAERIRTSYGPSAQEILEEQGGYYLDEAARRERQAAILKNWDYLKEWVEKNVPQPRRIKELLGAAGAPSSFTDLGVPVPLVKTMLDNAKEVRKRYTVLRLAEDLGLMPGELCYQGGEARPPRHNNNPVQDTEGKNMANRSGEL